MSEKCQNRKWRSGTLLSPSRFLPATDAVRLNVVIERRDGFIQFGSCNSSPVSRPAAWLIHGSDK
jgi:hypothetical protein